MANASGYIVNLDEQEAHNTEYKINDLEDLPASKKAKSITSSDTWNWGDSTSLGMTLSNSGDFLFPDSNSRLFSETDIQINTPATQTYSDFLPSVPETPQQSFGQPNLQIPDTPLVRDAPQSLSEIVLPQQMVQSSIQPMRVSNPGVPVDPTTKPDENSALSRLVVYDQDLQQLENGLAGWKQNFVEQVLLQKPDAETISACSNYLTGVEQTGDQLLQALLTLKSSGIFTPQEIHYFNVLIRRLFIVQNQRVLYSIEFQNSQQGMQNGLLDVKIVWQSFPKAITKGQRQELELKIFHSTNIELVSVDNVVVTLGNPSIKTPKTLVIDAINTAQFEEDNTLRVNVRFPTGTNKKPSKLKVKLDVRIIQSGISEEMTRSLETNESQPLIVTTNANQWLDAGGILLSMFAGVSTPKDGTISVYHFLNSLQEFFLVATEQQGENPTRPLSRYDIHYFLEQRFQYKERINSADFQKFWEWFGACFTKLTHQRHLLDMWKKGLVMGFISKELSEDLLRGQPECSFLLRFSYNAIGKICISYVKKGTGQINHYLIKKENTSGNAKTIAHYLVEDVPSINFILQLTDMAYPGRFTFIPKDKRTMLSTYIKDKGSSDAENTPDGYEWEIN